MVSVDPVQYPTSNVAGMTQRHESAPHIQADRIHPRTELVLPLRLSTRPKSQPSVTLEVEDTQTFFDVEELVVDNLDAVAKEETDVVDDTLTSFDDTERAQCQGAREAIRTVVQCTVEGINDPIEIDDEVVVEILEAEMADGTPVIKETQRLLEAEAAIQRNGDSAAFRAGLQ